MKVALWWHRSHVHLTWFVNHTRHCLCLLYANDASSSIEVLIFSTLADAQWLRRWFTCSKSEREWKTQRTAWLECNLMIRFWILISEFAITSKRLPRAMNLNRKTDKTTLTLSGRRNLMETMKIQISTISAFFCLRGVASSTNDKTTDKICPGHWGAEERSSLALKAKWVSRRTSRAISLARLCNYTAHNIQESTYEKMSERLAARNLCTREILITIIINKIFYSL